MPYDRRVLSAVFLASFPSLTHGDLPGAAALFFSQIEIGDLNLDSENTGIIRYGYEQCGSKGYNL